MGAVDNTVIVNSRTPWTMETLLLEEDDFDDFQRRLLKELSENDRYGSDLVKLMSESSDDNSYESQYNFQNDDSNDNTSEDEYKEAEHSETKRVKRNSRKGIKNKVVSLSENDIYGSDLVKLTSESSDDNSYESHYNTHDDVSNGNTSEDEFKDAKKTKTKRVKRKSRKDINYEVFSVEEEYSSQEPAYSKSGDKRKRKYERKGAKTNKKSKIDTKYVNTLKSNIPDPVNETEDDEAVCAVCHAINPPSLSNSSAPVDWLGCDCGVWFHNKCIVHIEDIHEFTCDWLGRECRT